jgi:competence protein ComEA
MPDAPPHRPGPALPDPGFWGDGRPGRRRVPRPGGGALDALTDRLAAWRTDARAGVALLAVAAVVAGVVWYRIGVGGGDPPPARTAATATTRAAPASGSAPVADESQPAGGRLVVHVAGAVANPGVVELVRGARVIDAIEAAGGGAAEADLDRLNLASKVVDGQRVLVQRVGEPAVAAAPGDGTGSADPTTTGGLINVNTATALQLEELPGIGPVLATAIIAERDRRGTFRSVNELRDVRGIGEQRFADIRDLVTV